jgi:hypothetical protein
MSKRRRVGRRVRPMRARRPANSIQGWLLPKPSPTAQRIARICKKDDRSPYGGVDGRVNAR